VIAGLGLGKIIVAGGLKMEIPGIAIFNLGQNIIRGS
jgi:hypothetical protein